MQENIAKLIVCFKELGFKPRVENFQDRLIMQKTAYLLQKLGINFGFNFGLHVRGPYSPDLARAVYSNRKETENLETNCGLSEDEKEMAKKLKSATGMKPVLLEIAATHAFLRYGLGMSEDDVLKKLKEMKPFYSESEIAVGTSCSKLLLFKPTKEDLEELKLETEPWQKAIGESWAKFD